MKYIIFIIFILIANVSFAGGSVGTMGAASVIREGVKTSK